MCFYYLICKKGKFDGGEFEEKIRKKFKNCFYIEDYYKEKNFIESRIYKLISRITTGIEDSSFYIVIHFGGLNDSQQFCSAISQWKKRINNDKLKAILPITSKKSDSPAFELYKKLEAGFENIEDLNLDEYKMKWEEECGIWLKKRIIPLLLGLSLSIDGAEIFRKKNDTGKYESMMKEINGEIDIINGLKEQIEKQPVEEWLIFLKSIRKIIAAAKLYDPGGEKKEFHRIFKEVCLEIKKLRELLETQK